MAIFFWLSTSLYSLYSVFLSVKRKKIITLPNLMFLSTIFPFILYLCHWSYYCDDCNWITYFVISIFEILVVLFSLFYYRDAPYFNHSKFYLKTLRLGKIRIEFPYLMLFVVLVCAAIENFYLSGTVVPFLKAIDTHTSVMPIVGPFLRAFSPVAYIFCFLYFDQKKDFWIIPFSLLVIIYQVLSSGSRYSFLQEVMVAAAFIYFYKRIDAKKTTWKSLLLFLGFIFVVVGVVFLLGEKRVGNADYEDLIQYSGPFKGSTFGSMLAWYYGYFSLSFANLNKGLMNVFDSNLYTSGRFFLAPFNDLLKIHYFLPYQTEDLEDWVRVVTVGAATVPTAFLYFFADFGFFFFVTPLFYLLSFWLGKKNGSFSGTVYSSYMVVVFFFFGFMDAFLNGIPLYSFLLALICQFVCLKPIRAGNVYIRELVVTI